MAQTKGTEDSALFDKQKIGKQIFGIGLNASLTSGMGVSFKHHLGGIPFAYQISGGYLQLGDNQIYSYGIELQYDINLKSTDRLYAVVGGGKYGSTDSTGANTLDFPYRWGAGIGYELSITRHINVSVNVMITGKQFGNNIVPLPSAAFHYYFQ
jgi:hypothetical protein